MMDCNLLPIREESLVSIIVRSSFNPTYQGILTSSFFLLEQLRIGIV